MAKRITEVRPMSVKKAKEIASSVRRFESDLDAAYFLIGALILNRFEPKRRRRGK